MSFPKWQYTRHKVTPRYGDLVRPGFIGRIINSQEEIDALGGEWFDTPTEMMKVTAETISNVKSFEEVKEETMESLRESLDAKGIAYDKRWGIAKLKEALNG